MESLPEKELTLRDLISIYRRRRKVVYSVFVTVFVLGALYCTLCTRRYQATGTVQMQKESVDAMGLDSIMGGAEGASDALDANIELQTQANILQSDTLALRAIEDLHMEGTYDFKPRFNPISFVLSLFTPAGVPDAPNATLDNAPQRRRRALKVFAKNLEVKPVSGTRLIEIDYSSPDPQLAAAVVNKLMAALVDYTFQTRYNATNQASQWLNGQMGDLRKNSEDLQAKVVGLQKQSGVYSLGTTDAQGREQAYSGVLDKMQQTTAAMTAAEQNRILKGAIARAAETGDAEMLSGLAGNSMIGVPQSVSNSMLVIQNLREQEASEQAALQQMEAKFGVGYPKLVELRGNIAGLERSIHAEIGRIKGRAESDYAVAQQTEAGTRQQYGAIKAQADQLNDKAVEYAIVRQEAEESRALYEDLFKRLNEAGVLAGLKSSNITVVDPGRVPAKPKKPNVPLYMAIAVGAGFFLGCCGALLRDTLDNKINSVAELEELTGQGVLGALPRQPVHTTPDGKLRIRVLSEPFSTFAEALRALRTALLLSRSDKPPKLVLITSSIPGEGKSTLSINLATVLAQTGRSVLLVDVDMRKGTLADRLSLPPSVGLSTLLTGTSAAPVYHTVPDASGLTVLVAGVVPPNPSELLGSHTMQDWLARWRTEYDFVILDTPPVLPVTDAMTLNSFVDATVLVSRSGVTEKPQLKRSYQMLSRAYGEAGTHYVGVVLNGLQVNDESYYGYYGYRNDAYAKGEGHDA